MKLISLLFSLLSFFPAVAQQPLTLPTPITRWDEAVPLGNGTLGGLLWGEGNTIRLSLDRGDLWDERLPEMLTRPDWTWATMVRLKEARDHTTHVEMFDKPYDTIPYPTKLPGGRLELTLDPAQLAQSFSLDLKTAHATVPLSRGRITAFYSATSPVAMLRIEHPDLPPPNLRIIRPAGLDKLGYAPAEHGSRQSDPAPGGPDDSLIWMTQRTVTGAEYTIAVHSRREQDTTTIALTIQSTPDGIYDGPASLTLAQAVTSQALTSGYDKRLEDHEKWWRDFWSASSISIPDAALQKHYDLCKYFYGAASRQGSPPIPLQGVWTCDNGDLPPWKGDYHNDLNTQATYTAYAAAGLFESGRSFLDFNSKLLPQYRAFAKSFYGVDGAVVPGVMTLGGKPMGGWGQYSLAPTHSAWIAQSFYQHWRYTQDHIWLEREGYPWCAAVGEALLNILKPDERGRLMLPLSTSPEIHDNSYKAWLPPNTNYDLALLRFLFAANAEMADALGQPADRWTAALAALDPLDVDPETHALAIARGHPFAASHRHFSHSMAIHPLGLLSTHHPANDHRTIFATLDEIATRGTSAWCGYSFSWFAAMNARAGRAEVALDHLQKYERAFTSPNGFHLNGDQSGTGLSSFTYRPFTLEGNFLAMHAIHEMLLQSWSPPGSPPVIRIFPALPNDWQTASFSNLRAEGGVRVTAVRSGFQTSHVRIESDRPTTILFAQPFLNPNVSWQGATVKLGPFGLLTADLQPGIPLTAGWLP